MKDNAKTKKKLNLSTIIMLLIALAVVWIIFALLSPYFLGWNNIANLLKYSSVTGIAAAGTLIVIISGGLDLSIGSIVALTGMVTAKFLSFCDIWWLGVIVGVAVGMLCGALNGALITVVKINHFITGLGTMTILRGLAYIVNDALAVSITNNTYKFIGQGSVFSIPIIVIIMVITFAAVGLILKYTKFGRYVYSMGGNARATYLAGINVNVERFKVYVISGLMAGIAGVCQSSLTGTANPTAASDLGMVAISSVVLGGASLSGGKGGIAGTLIGIIMLGTISNGLTLLNLSQYYQDICRGIILLFAVALDTWKTFGKSAQ